MKGHRNEVLIPVRSNMNITSACNTRLTEDRDIIYQIRLIYLTQTQQEPRFTESMRLSANIIVVSRE